MTASCYNCYREFQSAYVTDIPFRFTQRYSLAPLVTQAAQAAQAARVTQAADHSAKVSHICKNCWNLFVYAKLDDTMLRLIKVIEQSDGPNHCGNHTVRQTIDDVAWQVLVTCDASPADLTLARALSHYESIMLQPVGDYFKTVSHWRLRLKREAMVKAETHLDSELEAAWPKGMQDESDIPNV